MFNDIKITMLGASSAGKTCFMVGMYALMREGVRGFTFSTQDPDDDLELSEHWDKMLEPGANRWPPPTDQSKDYRFDFNFGFKAIMGFEWHDYRGKALLGKSSEPDVQALVSRLKGSSCVLLCVSGEHLAKGGIENLPTVTARALVARMNLRLTEVAKEADRNGAKRPAVVVVLTKYDKCSHRQLADVLGEVRELFNPLFTPGCGWTATICPVSLGEGLSQDLDGGAIDPRKVHLPVVFSIYCVLKREVASHRSSAQEKRGQLADLETRNFFSRWWNSDEIASLGHAVQLSEKELQRIEDQMKLLCKELVTGLQVYHDGEEVDFDV